MQPDLFLAHSLRDLRVARVLSAALHAVEPQHLVAKYFRQNPLPPHNRVFLLGIGKAAEGMTRAAASCLEEISGALAVTKQAAVPLPPGGKEPDGPVSGTSSTPSIQVLEAGHPIPDARSLAAGRTVLRFVADLDSEDLLVCLISGGGSALVAAPTPGVSLDDVKALTDALLRSGASINEMNALRRRLDTLKGGGLAAATRASILGLILSDVVGDPLEVIASGPTVPDLTPSETAIAILGKYGIQPSESVRTALRHPKTAQGPPAFGRVRNAIIGDVGLAIEGAREAAALAGFDAIAFAANIQGEARVVGGQLASRLDVAARTRPRPFCLIGGGETTVSLGAVGKGGRNQEVALGAVDAIDGLERVLLITLATDGNDGPTDAAGAVVTGETRRRASKLGMLPADYLAHHDSYPFFDALGDLLRPGYTGTNVSDLMLLIGL